MTPLPTRGWEAHLQANPVMRTLDVVVFRPFTARPAVGEFVGQIGERTERVRRDSDADLSTPPTLRMPEEIAAALFGALLEHFGGPGADRELRADYLHERDRVDRLLEVVTRPPQIVHYEPGTPTP